MMKEARTLLESQLTDIENRSRRAVRTAIAEGDSSSESAISEVLTAAEVSTIRQIKAALNRIECGAYGVCERCEDDISRARLEAIPFATKCARCQNEQDAAGPTRRPPHLVWTGDLVLDIP
jgi:RNA polymerase-binding transcription factor DksA